MNQMEIGMGEEIKKESVLFIKREKDGVNRNGCCLLKKRERTWALAQRG